MTTPDKCTPANGIEGFLIWTGKTYMFRVYNKDKTFTDYNIRHSDLGITINDSDATLYEYDDGIKLLDHNPETLGYE